MLNLRPNLDAYPDLYRNYTWQKKHALYGYAADTFDNSFPWISSLESRFDWVRHQHEQSEDAGAASYLIRELVQWGGAQNGVLQKFEDGLERVCLADVIHGVITALGAQENAIRGALSIPGLGLTYASKLLRFLDPARYAALDSRIRAGCNCDQIRDGQRDSEVKGYLGYLEDLRDIARELREAGIPKPAKSASAPDSARAWRMADIEMALFQFAAKTRASNKKRRKTTRKIVRDSQ